MIKFYVLWDKGKTMKKISSYISYIILKKSKINTLLDKKNLIINHPIILKLILMVFINGKYLKKMKIEKIYYISPFASINRKKMNLVLL